MHPGCGAAKMELFRDGDEDLGRADVQGHLHVLCDNSLNSNQLLKTTASM